jgi:DICT domain-containing protein
VSDELSIGDVADLTGLAAGTIRMWEQRYGAPQPRRRPSGYRAYGRDDVDLLRRAIAYRERGLSVSAALERARESGTETDRPSIYAAVASSAHAVRTNLLGKPTLLALSRAIEDETLAHAAAPLCFGAFQQERFYRAVEHRYRRLCAVSDATVVFADFSELRDEPERPVEIPIEPDDALGNEWAVVVDAPGYAACLLAWEQAERYDRGGPDEGERRFEAMWTIDPVAVRRAALVGAHLAGRSAPAVGRRLTDLLAERPLAAERPATALTALTNRMVGYLEHRLAS